MVAILVEHMWSTSPPTPALWTVIPAASLGIKETWSLCISITGGQIMGSERRWAMWASITRERVVEHEGVDWPKSLLVFFRKMATVALSCL